MYNIYNINYYWPENLTHAGVLHEVNKTLDLQYRNWITGIAVGDP